MKAHLKILLAGSALAAGGLLVAAPGMAQDFEFVHASLNPTNHIDYPVNMDFVNRVEELSEGRISFRVFEGGVLGDEREMMEQIATGTITTARLTPAGLSSIWPEMSMPSTERAAAMSPSMQFTPKSHAMRMLPAICYIRCNSARTG